MNRSRLRMRRLAKTDMLTGLFNRRFLEEWFAKPAEQKPKLIEKPIPETKKGQLVHKLNKQVMRVQYGYLALNHWVERKLDKQKMVAKKAGNRAYHAGYDGCRPFQTSQRYLWSCVW